ncbi:MAG: protein-disulfide reductase DsbD N-terminal domain-containing protein, partial [Streptosporangiaceae bacterium]
MARRGRSLMSRRPRIGWVLLLAGSIYGITGGFQAGAAQPSTAATVAALNASSPGAAVVTAAVGSALPGQPKFLPPDKVFHVAATPAGAGAIRLDWWIRDGYYLYRSRLKVSAGDGVKLGALQLPAGKIKIDPYFGREEIYRNAVSGAVAVPATGVRNLSLQVTYQGCADAGLCYPPITKILAVALPPAGTAASGAGSSAASTSSAQPDP